jgi:hypothetical protein
MLVPAAKVCAQVVRQYVLQTPIPETFRVDPHMQLAYWRTALTFPGTFPFFLSFFFFLAHL